MISLSFVEKKTAKAFSKNKALSAVLLEHIQKNISIDLFSSILSNKQTNSKEIDESKN